MMVDVTLQHQPSEEELVARARELIPMLRSRAEACERNRMVSPDTIREFQEAGFFRILQPRQWGGYEMSPTVFYRVLMELGRGCGNSAWVAMVLGVHQWEFGLMDARAAADVWSRDTQVLVASSYAPWGECTRVEGGWVLNGTWKTSSGCDHAQWAFLGGVERDASGMPIDRLAFLVSGSDYVIQDDWHVFGLSGTGSKSLVVKNAFVPDYRVHSQVVHDHVDQLAPSYRYPFLQTFCAAVSSVLVGMAQGAVDEYTRQMSARKDTVKKTAVALSPYVKDRLANAIHRVRTARARLFSTFAESAQSLERGEVVPLDLRVQHRLDLARTGHDCEEAVMLLFKATGAQGIYDSNQMQMILRNVLAGSQHITQNADDSAGVLGGFVLGQDLPPTLYSRAVPA